MSLYQLQKPMFTLLIISWVMITSKFMQRTEPKAIVYYALILIVYAALVQIIRSIEPPTGLVKPAKND